LNSFENRVFDLKLYSGEHVVAKFYRPLRWSREQIQEEHDFLFELIEHEIPVCAPICFSDGQSLHTHNEIYYALWSRTGGRAPDELSEIDLEMLARLFARLHTVGAAKKFAARPHFNADSHVNRVLDLLLAENLIPDALQSRYAKLCGYVASAYTQFASGESALRIHGDAHLGNILRNDQGFFLLDFDDALNGPAMQDLWMLIPPDDELYRREKFLSAYRSIRDLNETSLALIEVMRAMRFIYYSGWIAKRWSDPAFKAAFPQFADIDYWQKELNSLEQQCALLPGSAQSEIGRSASLADSAEHSNLSKDSELTNKDFFYDM